MGLIIFFVIWYFAYARNNPKIFSKLKKKKGLIIFILIALFFSNASGSLFSLSFGLGSLLIPAYVIYRIIKSISAPDETAKNKEFKKEAKEVRNSTIPKSEQLPNAVPKRIRIV